ncbi:thymidine phosphorylase-like [Bacillus rossius redtenbacheri]|uniref:thymidine phosphorylase-like n=1 Tax=Bacillus rossius redtenbacheri TaxID=93214 RepID=UPI002FDDD6FE
MAVPELIRKKRDGEALSDEDVAQFVRSAVDGSAQDCQLGAMLMAMYLQGLSDRETASLTHHMAHSGDVLSWDPAWSDLLVDKHSTGGVGDKVSLPLAPALAALGFKVPMVSGRGLAFTGGTLDKLESIPGFRVQLEVRELEEALRQAGCFIAGPTGRLAPADKELYQRRDVTSTVDSVPLVVASIVSKKVAAGARLLVMDIKVGKAAFFKDVKTARTLAHKLIRVAKDLGLSARAVLTRMDAPVGRAVGNSLEVAEAVECLRGGGPPDLAALVATLGAVLLMEKGRAASLEEGQEAVRAVLQSGAALRHFRLMLRCQGVAERAARELCGGDPWRVLPRAPGVARVLAPRDGWVADVDALAVGRASWRLGAGRSRADQAVDPRVGVLVLRAPGEPVREGEPLLEAHHAGASLPEDVLRALEAAVTVAGADPGPAPSPVLQII